MKFKCMLKSTRLRPWWTGGHSVGFSPTFDGVSKSQGRKRITEEKSQKPGTVLAMHPPTQTPSLADLHVSVPNYPVSRPVILFSLRNSQVGV